MAQSALVSARTDPTERSMPPVVMTSVMAVATISSGADWRRMLRILSSDRKASVVTENSTTTAAKNSAIEPTLPLARKRSFSVRGRSRPDAGVVAWSGAVTEQGSPASLGRRQRRRTSGPTGR